jgi:hypothetical protein
METYWQRKFILSAHEDKCASLHISLAYGTKTAFHPSLSFHNSKGVTDFVHTSHKLTLLPNQCAHAHHRCALTQWLTLQTVCLTEET